jgi:hypothetical protein
MDQVSDEMDVETNHTSTGEHANEYPDCQGTNPCVFS